MIFVQEKDDGPSIALQAVIAGKEDEVMAICKIRGVDESSPVGKIFKVLVVIVYIYFF